MTKNPIKGPKQDLELTTRPRKRERKRSDIIADALKDYIAQKGLRPGERLPQEAELITLLGASKGTVREALKSMETQGIIATRTGPGGGAFYRHRVRGTRGRTSGQLLLFQGSDDPRHLRASDIAGTGNGCGLYRSSGRRRFRTT